MKKTSEHGRDKPIHSPNKLRRFVPVALLVLTLLAACAPQVIAPVATQIPPPPETTPSGEPPPFFATGKIMPGDTWEGAMTRLFGTLYPDFWGMGNMQYAAMIGETRLGRSEGADNFTCVVFPDRDSAEQGTDLLFGNGAVDADNLLGPLWVDQPIAAGKRDSLEAQAKALGCGNEYWTVFAEREYSVESNTQTWMVYMNRIKAEENGPGFTTAMATFRFFNGEFNSWQGGWEVQIGDKWLPVSKLREKLQGGYNFNDAIQQLHNEVQQQSHNKLVDPRGLRGTARDPRHINTWKQARQGGWSSKPRM